MDPAAEGYRRECQALIRKLIQELEGDMQSRSRAVSGAIAEEYRKGQENCLEQIRKLQREIARL